MRENYLITKSIRKASSLIRYEIRLYKDTCLHNDVGYFTAYRQPSVSVLVDKLLNNDFVLARYSDPTYPV